MKNLTLLLLLFSVFSFSQTKKELTEEIVDFQHGLNREYSDPKETPLRGTHFKNFKGHPFFPADLKYRVTAQFTATEDAVPFELPTSSGGTQPYREFGTATFDLDGETYVLKIYQNLNLIKRKEYRDHLFLPFRDETNGKETYGGGKYMDLRIPTGKMIILDFNKSYQPFCAYNAYEYSCPIVPAENTLPISIMAGVKYDDVYFEH
jgi:uncharacterized protein (DUF1684 family)